MDFTLGTVIFLNAGGNENKLAITFESDFRSNLELIPILNPLDPDFKNHFLDLQSQVGGIGVPSVIK